MDKSQVRALLGEPTVTRGPSGVRVEHEGDSEPTIAATAGIGFAIMGDPRESWEYKRNASAKLTQAEFDSLPEGEQAEILIGGLFSEPSDDSCTVIFGDDDRVIELRRPIDKEANRQQ